MKLYQTTAQNGADPLEVRWNSSGAAARYTATRFKKEGLKNVSTEEVNVPTNRTDLMAWLNVNQVVAVVGVS